ncbi:exodeoxyribonuclease VII small subunit [Qipengyuania sp. DSG2-2]|uniref:exodeoxyribonuclease VII small subunit n=1 Tax=Qipengyuania sp. DGS2-2 TaxID=3349631 RepID=UPI0036D4012E
MLRSMEEGSNAASTAITDMTFEQALAALEQVVRQLESGDVPLDESINLYSRGEELRKACQARLDAAQARIEAIVQDGDGKATGTRPFDSEPQG